MFSSVEPRADEIMSSRPGDDVVLDADVVMDRAFSVDASPHEVWPWLVQLGKGRAGWYLPRRIERFMPRRRRAIRRIDLAWQALSVGDVIPDYGGKGATFEAVEVAAPNVLVYRSRRGQMFISWSITLAPVGEGTRVHLRLRLRPVRRRWLADRGGGFFDALTIAGMAAGLRERLDNADHLSR